MPDVTLSTGADNSGIKAGLAELRNEVKSTRADIVSTMGQAITFGGLVGAFEQVVEKAHQIHHEAERFGVDAQFLQIVGNAAKEDGVQLNAVAQAMNKLEINTQKARDGNEKAANSFAVLGINIDDVRRLSPDELFMRIADGVKNAEDKTAAYAAVAALLGARMGTELIPTLERGSGAIRQIGTDMGTMSDDTLKHLDEIHRQWAQLQNQLTVTLGGAVGSFVEFWQRGWYSIGMSVVATKDLIVSNVSVIVKALQGDLKGALLEFRTGIDTARAEFKEAFNQEGFDLGKPGSKAPAAGPGSQHVGLDAAEGNAREASLQRQIPLEEKVTSLAREHEALQERINKLNEDHYSKTLPAVDNLIRLEAQRKTLLEESEAITQRELQDKIDQGARDTNNLAIAQNQKEIDTARNKIAADYERTQAQLENEAERELATAEDRARLAELMLQHGEEQGRQLFEQEQREQKIEEVSDRINQAWAEGNQQLAETLTELRDQLQLENDIAKAIKDQVAAQRDLATALNSAGASVGKQAGASGSPSSPGRSAAGFGGNAPRSGNGIDNGPMIFNEDAVTMATNPYTGQVDERLLTTYRAMAAANAAAGLGSPWSVVEIMAKRKAIELNAAAAARRNPSGSQWPVKPEDNSPVPPLTLPPSTGGSAIAEGGLGEGGFESAGGEGGGAVDTRAGGVPYETMGGMTYSTALLDRMLGRIPANWSRIGDLRPGLSAPDAMPGTIDASQNTGAIDNSATETLVAKQESANSLLSDVRTLLGQIKDKVTPPLV